MGSANSQDIQESQFPLTRHIILFNSIITSSPITILLKFNSSSKMKLHYFGTILSLLVLTGTNVIAASPTEEGLELVTRKQHNCMGNGFCSCEFADGTRCAKYTFEACICPSYGDETGRYGLRSSVLLLLSTMMVIIVRYVNMEPD